MQINLIRFIQNQYFHFLTLPFSFLINIILFIFIRIFNFIQYICWKIYLLFTRLPPTQAWMDPREQTLIIKYIQEFKRKNEYNISKF